MTDAETGVNLEVVATLCSYASCGNYVDRQQKAARLKIVAVLFCSFHQSNNTVVCYLFFAVLDRKFFLSFVNFVIVVNLFKRM